MLTGDSVRMDKWLWAVRVFKTRSLAAACCEHGHVKVLGHAAKPSRPVRINDIIIVQKDQMTRTFKVLQLLEKRVGAPAVKDYMEDQTPAAEFDKPRDPYMAVAARPKGSGRPTKKERRQLDALP